MLFFPAPVLLLSLCSLVATHQTTYYMDENCGNRLFLNTEHTKSLSLHLTSAKEYGANMNCYVTISSDVGTRIMTSFVWININSFLHCPGDFVEIMNTEDLTNQTHGSVLRSTCGNDVPNAAVTSRGNSVTIRFVSDGAFFGKGFHILLTQYHTGPCSNGEFTCDNGHCIHSDLYCDDNAFDHCGDLSDHCRLSMQIIVCVVSAVIVLAVVMMLVAVLLWDRLRRARNADDVGDDDVCDDSLDWTQRSPGSVIVEPSPTSIYILPRVADILTSLSITHVMAPTDQLTSQATRTSMTSLHHSQPSSAQNSSAAVRENNEA